MIKGKVLHRPLKIRRNQDIKDQEKRRKCNFLATYDTFMLFPVLIETAWQHIYCWCSRLPDQWRETQEEELKASYGRCSVTSQDPWLQILILLGLWVSSHVRWQQYYFRLFIWTHITSTSNKADPQYLKKDECHCFTSEQLKTLKLLQTIHNVTP